MADNEKDLQDTEDDDDEDEIIVLENDKGEQVEFMHLATIDYLEKWYLLLQPVEAGEDMEEDDVVIFELGETDEGETLIPVEDDDILNGVYEEFLKECEKDND